MIGSTLVLFFDPTSIESLSFFLKLTVPVYLYYFLRRFFRTKRDLDGVLQAFLYSGLIVAGVLLYEIFVNPIRVEESRGMERIQGNFGDVVSYGIYVVFCFLIVTYFYFTRQFEVTRTNRLLAVVIVGAIGLLGLFNIHHIASYAVFGMIFLMFLLYNFRTAPETAVFPVDGMRHSGFSVRTGDDR